MQKHRYPTIFSDFKKNWLFLVILGIGTIPSIFMGYSMYILVLLFPIILFNSSIRLNAPIIVSLLFGILYTIPLYAHTNPPTPSNAVFYMTYPVLFYMIPNYLLEKFKNPNSMLIVLIMVVTCIASWSITVNIEDTVVSGELVNMRRALSENLKDIQGVTSATNHNMMLALAIGGIGMLFCQTRSHFDKSVKVYLIILGGFALFSAFHLVNRTAIVLVAAACIVGMLVGGISAKRAIALTMTTLTLIIIFSIAMESSTWVSDVLSGFESRETNSAYGMTTVGNRDVRWLAAVSQIPIRPFGDDALRFMGGTTYAHNTWLDCAIQSGWIPFILLIYITWKMLASVIKVVSNKCVSLFDRSYLAILTSVMILQLMVEPGIQGVFLLFLMIFFMWSYANGMNYKYLISKRNGNISDITYGA
ncbi:hypothetical protein [uncultured Muribaculum sp.]|uniref:O-antigen ligase family protein n=1 Tax=uncultured Muribaculum sp. TaxID=1918613 RepID=UPI0025CEB96F|nr:hypothetical protein [uncultured Muribaculum sp.]